MKCEWCPSIAAKQFSINKRHNTMSFCDIEMLKININMCRFACTYGHMRASVLEISIWAHADSHAHTGIRVLLC